MSVTAPHSFPIRIYYEDTDFSGNVYHAAYLKFFERARTELLREAGIHHAELAEQGVAFAVRSMEIDYLGAAHIDDLLSVTTSLGAISGARLTLHQTIWRGEEKLTEAKVVVASIKTTGGPARMPGAVRALAEAQKG